MSKYDKRGRWPLNPGGLTIIVSQKVMAQVIGIIPGLVSCWWFKDEILELIGKVIAELIQHF